MWTGSGSEVGRWGNPVRGTRISRRRSSATAGISNSQMGVQDQSHHRTSDVIFCGVERLPCLKGEDTMRYHLSIDIETKAR